MSYSQVASHRSMVSDEYRNELHARADGPRRLRKLAPDFRPGLNQRGENTLRILTMMQGGRSNQEIAQTLAGLDPASFKNVEEALQRVQGLAMRYGK